MTCLDKNMQRGLKTAACLGSNFDAEILQKAKKDDDFDMDMFLVKCVEDGYLVSSDGSKQFAWAHDQVHQAAYELISIEKRELFHLLLGSRLLMKSSSSESSKMLFFVVDNMNRGVKLLENSAQKHELAFLNLRAGERGELFASYHRNSNNYTPPPHRAHTQIHCFSLFSSLFSNFIFGIPLSVKVPHHWSITART
jgi:predicted ATPase